jgi:hypothetical protein
MTTKTDHALEKIQSMLTDGLISEKECEALKKLLGIQQEKRFYKKWWGLVIAAVLIIVVICSCNSNDSTLLKAKANEVTSKNIHVVSESLDNETEETLSKSTSQASVEETVEEAIQPQQEAPDQTPTPMPFEVVNEGMYKVGIEMPAGEYMIIRDDNGYGAYYEVTKDSSGDFDSIISNENVDTFHIISISDGQYFEITGGFAVLFDDFNKEYPVIGLSETGEYLPGMYKVGVNLKAGEYKLTAEPDGYGGYFEVLKNSTGEFDCIKTNDCFDANKYITVTDGEYFLVSGATFRLVE